MGLATGLHGFFILSLNNPLNKLFIIEKQTFVGSINLFAHIL